ncbi:MAG: flagellar protein FlaG [Lachnospiraceae bacterium]|nr:flagellar protein FlaG [Lachnospiraceae bacterium]
MTIEPLGSVMTMQAQPVQNKPAVQPAKPAVEYTDGAVTESAKIDKNTSIVENATQKGDADSQTKDQQNANQQVTNEQIKKAVEQLNKNMNNSSAVFGIHEETNRVTIKIVDKDTKEVIKELPPEKTLDMISKVWELAGIMVDEKR